MGIYLDYNASAPIDNRVLEMMIDIYKNVYGNAESRTHVYGDNARKIVETARFWVARLLGVESSEVFFTSGSTESNNLAIRGLIEYAEVSRKKHIITSTIEHKSILESVRSLKKMGFEIDLVDPEEDGRLNPQKVISLLREDTLLVSLMHVNNETGIIQPIKEIGDVLYERGILFHVDATQSCGKLVQELRNVKYNMLSLSAHKFSGPQGIGALILRRKQYKLPPVKAIFFGGKHENGIRPGTVPVALAAGLGKACELADMEYKENNMQLIKIKQIVIQLIGQSGLRYLFNGDQKFCMPNTINVSFLGVESEALMLSTKQFCGVSNGSACTSYEYNPSYVLMAMGLDTNRVSSAIRISWGVKTDREDLVSNLTSLMEVAKGLVV